MTVWQIGLAILLATLSLVAVGISVYAMFSGGRLDVALVAAVILLAMAQLLALFARTNTRRGAVTDIRDLMRANESLSQDQTLLRRRLDRMETALVNGKTAAARQLDSQVRALEQSVSALAEDQHQHHLASETRTVQSLQTADKGNSQPTPSELDLYLEPIVQLQEKRTTHYRATLAVRQGDAEPVPVARIMREAERAGFLGELDLAIFELAAPVIRRLQRKGRQTAVICPVSAPSFSDHRFIQSLIAFLDRNSDIATSLIVELTQGALSKLAEQGQEGLARLAQLGTTFSLSNIRPDVPDLRTLHELGFRYLSMDVRLLISVMNDGNQSGVSLIRHAQDCGLALLAADVVKESELSWIDQSVPLAFGNYFSPPRLVRHDITVAEEPAKVA